MSDLLTKTTREHAEMPPLDVKSPIVLLAERVAMLEHDLETVTKRLNWMESRHYGTRTEDPQGIWPTNPIQALNLSKAKILNALGYPEQATIDPAAPATDGYNSLIQPGKPLFNSVHDAEKFLQGRGLLTQPIQDAGISYECQHSRDDRTLQCSHCGKNWVDVMMERGTTQLNIAKNV